MIRSDDVRSGLTSAAVGVEQVHSDAGRIRAAAERRHAAVQSRIEGLRPKVGTDAEAAAEYEALIAERGRLAIVLGGAE